MRMKAAKELGLKWKPNVAVPAFALCNDEEMMCWGLVQFEILIVWMRQVLQLLLIDCGGAKCLLPAAMQPLIQTQRRQVTMSTFPWLFKAKSSWSCLGGKKKINCRERSGRLM